VSYLTPQSKSVASLISLLTFLFFSALAAAHTVDLSWNASTSTNIVGAHGLTRLQKSVNRFEKGHYGLCRGLGLRSVIRS
jgi:hypothetical protein